MQGSLTSSDEFTSDYLKENHFQFDQSSVRYSVHRSSGEVSLPVHSVNDTINATSHDVPGFLKTKDIV